MGEDPEGRGGSGSRGRSRRRRALSSRDDISKLTLEVVWSAGRGGRLEALRRVREAEPGNVVDAAAVGVEVVIGCGTHGWRWDRRQDDWQLREAGCVCVKNRGAEQEDGCSYQVFMRVYHQAYFEP